MAYVGANKGSVKPFFAYNKNGCGHAAVATCLKHFNKLTFPVGTAVDKIYARSPPDTSITKQWNFGCTPGHVENMCKLYGLKTSRFDSRAGTQYVWDKLQTAIRGGKMVIVLMDNGKLGGSWGGHFIVAYGYDSSSVYCVNMIDMPDAKIPNKKFDEAWHTWFVPSAEFHYSGIAVRAS
jgi:hypothetical protein